MSQRVTGGVIAGIVLSALMAAPVDSAPKPFPEFTFKMIKPPAPGTPPKIDVQIAPEDAQTTDAPIVQDPDAPAPSNARYSWFWDRVSPAVKAASPARIEEALLAIQGTDGGPSVPTPRLQLMMDVANRFGTTIMASTIGKEVSPALVLAVIWVESAGQPSAVSRSGAQGLMQLIPATADRFNVKDSFDPAQNIAGGVAYLDWLLRRFEGDPMLALAGYNAGENAVLSRGMVPDFPETRDYVPKVLAAYSVASGLCMTAPLFVTDGCVLRKMP
ncbi:lytic transglycosylase domain-containing protein [Donghicola tyrosinivorans]|uniref:Transglycosylase-like protein with SLT domain n=1 Tax=Donghicola tyrosinivorans TaxID=1652492 RepID=A0A2T0WF58_9RHOB|nr:lytic transglycosylase domain-containing protein [Donghicola tyrosinivorans]PRY85348.1 transglycosylase-like protein with SLT domain [Donghicola tyrosinivorans]